MKKITLMMLAGLLLRFGDGLCMENPDDDFFDAEISGPYISGPYIVPTTPRQDAVRRLLYDPYNTYIEDEFADVLTGEEDFVLCQLGNIGALRSYLAHHPTIDETTMDPTLLNNVACLSCNRLESMNALLDHGANPDLVEIDAVMGCIDKDDARSELAIAKVILLTRRGMDPLIKKRSLVFGTEEGLSIGGFSFLRSVRAMNDYNLFKHLFMRRGRIKD